MNNQKNNKKKKKKNKQLKLKNFLVAKYLRVHGLVCPCLSDCVCVWQICSLKIKCAIDDDDDEVNDDDADDDNDNYYGPGLVMPVLVSYLA